jgi:hypothetical protein
LKKLLFIPIALGLILLLSTCRKTEEDNFLDGTWRINSLKMNRDSADSRTLFFPSYNVIGSQCVYNLDFADNDIVIASYYVNDTLVFTKEGEWQLETKTNMHLVLDDFINGRFNLEKTDADSYVLTSDEDSNYVEMLDSIIKLTIKINRSQE